MAAVKAHADAVQLLLERGAAVNARNAFGFAPLHMAAHNDPSARCVSLLVYGGADVDAANRFGRTPLHYAAECGNEAALRALLAAGARRRVNDDEGRAPIDVAKTDAARRLLAPEPLYP
ncbi:hypothetical protein R5R35_002572 [Gryllus longicercus]|uniref:Ankyrin repeat domain-containing protein n=1 Tax=Gryllus longicercus TaxID=2509291 RepID=A0AAN9ZAJ3_9ORTH